MAGQQIVCNSCADKYGQHYECKRTMIAGGPGLKNSRCHICDQPIGKDDKYVWMNDEFVEKGRNK